MIQSKDMFRVKALGRASAEDLKAALSLSAALPGGFKWRPGSSAAALTCGHDDERRDLRPEKMDVALCCG